MTAGHSHCQGCGCQPPPPPPTPRETLPPGSSSGAPIHQPLALQIVRWSLEAYISPPCLVLFKVLFVLGGEKITRNVITSFFGLCKTRCVHRLFVLSLPSQPLPAPSLPTSVSSSGGSFRPKPHITHTRHLYQHGSNMYFYLFFSYFFIRTLCAF